jgi:hypothetical protein
MVGADLVCEFARDSKVEWREYLFTDEQWTEFNRLT